MSEETKNTTELLTERQVNEEASQPIVLNNPEEIAAHMNQVNAEAETKKKEVLTEVTSVHQEELKTGEEAKITPEQMQDLAVRDYFAGMMTISKELSTLSNRGVRRLMIALLQLPHSDEPVKLVSAEEKRLFGIGQRVQMSRMYLMMNSMKNEIKARKNTTAETLDSNKENVNVEPTNTDQA